MRETMNSGHCELTEVSPLDKISVDVDMLHLYHVARMSDDTSLCRIPD